MTTRGLLDAAAQEEEGHGEAMRGHLKAQREGPPLLPVPLKSHGGEGGSRAEPGAGSPPSCLCQEQKAVPRRGPWGEGRPQGSIEHGWGKEQCPPWASMHGPRPPN